ncbi:MAG TPA: hypothetical protein VGM90_05515 [Kofleriaceae bacterium]
MEYVTRRELREELAPIHAVLQHIVETMERGFRELRQEFRQELRQELGAQIGSVRQELAVQIRASADEVRRDVAVQIRASAEALRAEMREDMTAMLRVNTEETRMWFATLDDKYKDIPARVTALEQRGGPSAARRRTTKRT